MKSRVHGVKGWGYLRVLRGLGFLDGPRCPAERGHGSPSVGVFLGASCPELRV